MRLTDSNGDRFFKVIRFRLFDVGNKTSRVTRLRAPAGHAYSSSDVDKYLETFADEIGEKFPGQEYSAVEVGPGEFNFVWRGSLNAEGPGVVTIKSRSATA